MWSRAKRKPEGARKPKAGNVSGDLNTGRDTAAAEEGDDEEDEEDDEEDAGNAGGHAGNAGETEGRGDEGDKEEEKGVSQHTLNIRQFLNLA